MREDEGVTRECIHGFEIELCDICSPRRPPERTVPSRRAPDSVRPGGRGSRPKTSRARATPIIDPAQHRVFHVTHVDTLDAILHDGALRPAVAAPVDLSTPLIRQLRASVPATPDRAVSECVSFAISDQASWWRDLREGAHDRTRWSDAARSARPADLVVLVARLGDLSGAVVADADAASAVARIAREPAEIARAVARSRGEGSRDGEALVPGDVPIESVVLIGVANEPARDRVRQMFASAGYPGVRVALSPEWFTRA